MAVRGADLTPKVGMFIIQHLWSDSNPYRIIEVSPSGKTVKCQRAVFEIDPTWKRDFRPGGFMGHTANNSTQRWIDTGENEGEIKTLRRNKRGGFGPARDSIRYTLSETARKFYDFNF